MLPQTKRQRQVLDYITRFHNEHGYSPSYQQIARDFGLASKGAIAKHIDALEKQGLLTRTRVDGSFRIKLNYGNQNIDSGFHVKLFTEADSNQEDSNSTFEFSLASLGIDSSKEICAFIVKDDSLSDEMIAIGDVAIFEHRPFARDRDFVLALIDNEKLLFRKYFRRGAEIELRPANVDFESEYFGADRVIICGVFKGLLRSII